MPAMYKKILNLYSAIDKTCADHYKKRKKQPPCSKGCASCCSQFFEISDLEFAVLFEHIDALAEFDKNKLKENARILYELLQDHWPDFYRAYFSSETVEDNCPSYYDHPDRYEVILPCVFLTPAGDCTVYERRPSICRTTGVGFQHFINRGAVCSTIPFALFTPFWQANLMPYAEAIESIRWLPSQDDSSEYKRLYPAFYYVYDALVLNNEDKYRALLDLYKSEAEI